MGEKSARSDLGEVSFRSINWVTGMLLLVREISLLQPSLEEQDAIVTFLDREAAKINRLIQTRQKQVAALREQRFAIIHHAVTKGIDPNTRMRPSGYVWLGEIPDHWQVYRLKFTARIKNGQDYKIVEADEGYPVIGSGGQFAWANSYLHDGESVLFGRKGTIDKPLYLNGKFWTVDTMFYTQIKDVIIPRFLYFSALCFPFEFYSTQTALPSMTQQDLGNHTLAVPPIPEQLAIVDHIDREISKVDALMIKYIGQLLGRYSTGRETPGLLINYVRKPDIKGIVGKLKEEMDKKLPEQQTGPCEEHLIKWSLLTRHKHNSGEVISIGHIGFNLYL